MRKAPETRDHGAMPAGEVCEARELGLVPCGRPMAQRLKERDRVLLAPDVLRVLEGQASRD